MTNTVPCYSRWEEHFDPLLKVDRVEFTGPDGKTEARPAFSHQPAEFSYDRHGYEALKAKGAPVAAVRFTPDKPGKWRYRALSGDKAVVEEGELTCEPSQHPGFVIVSTKDPRYFALTNGTSFCPIGLNLCWPETFALPSGKEFGTTGARGTLGCNQYKRWLSELSRNGGNFVRLWVAMGWFECQTETAGRMDDLQFNKLDRVVELARERGVRLKLCLDWFRRFKGSQMQRTLKHPDDGRSPKDMNEWFREKTWRDLWLKKVRAYEARYGGDPAVAVIELWNEINACEGDWEAKRDWTRDMLRELKPMFPKQLVVNSLGSYDSDWAKQHHVDFKMDEMAFQQVHRYLDQGAAYKICGDPVAFSIDAIQVARRPDRPVLLAETGGVNDNHTGPFRYCGADHRGIIFHDTTFPAFFAGAAGTGQIWFWDSYVDHKNFWPAFRPFADLMAGVQLDQEDFKAADLSNDKAWFLVLRGKKHVLAWARNKADRWDLVLRDGQEPPVLKDMVFDLSPLGVKGGAATLSSPWPEQLTGAKVEGGKLVLPAVRYGVFVKVSVARE